MAYGSVENRMSSAGMPIGSVIAYAGDIDSIPPGWHICDGTEGTPDLRGRFVLGQSSAYAYGSEGGEATHTLTVDELAEHRHGMRERGSFSTSPAVNIITGMSTSTTFSWALSDTPCSYEGGSKPHNNMPPYYALYYIMRIA